MTNNTQALDRLEGMHSNDPNDYRPITFDSWDEIFELQLRKHGANYSMLKEWLKAYYSVPELIFTPKPTSSEK